MAEFVKRSKAVENGDSADAQRCQAVASIIADIGALDVGQTTSGTARKV